MYRMADATSFTFFHSKVPIFPPYIFVEINLYPVGWEQKGWKRVKRVKQLMNGSPGVTLSGKQGRCAES
jgi:hypothetical protein